MNKIIWEKMDNNVLIGRFKNELYKKFIDISIKKDIDKYQLTISLFEFNSFEKGITKKNLKTFSNDRLKSLKEFASDYDYEDIINKEIFYRVANIRKGLESIIKDYR